MFDGEQPLIHGSWPARESVSYFAVGTQDPEKPIRSRPVPDKVENEGFRTTPFGMLEFFLVGERTVDAKHEEMVRYGYRDRREPVETFGPYAAMVWTARTATSSCSRAAERPSTKDGAAEARGTVSAKRLPAARQDKREQKGEESNGATYLEVGRAAPRPNEAESVFTHEGHKENRPDAHPSGRR